MKRQAFLKMITVVMMVSTLTGYANKIFADEPSGSQPNIILMMCDDLGWGDVGFNGNKIIKTPELDKMSKQGVVMRHFYAGGPVCSPTRGTCLTGRHYWRYGIWSANKGHLPKEEITIAGILKSKGYLTGHFGKWHLGTLSKTISSKGASRKPKVNYAPPWERDYDRSFVTESAVCTWDPGYGRRAKNNAFYDDGKPTMDNLKGGAARVVMDRVIPFIEKAAESKKPFLVVIWFHAPHEDIEAGPKYLDMYKDQDKQWAHYFGCVTEMDEQVGRLQDKLKSLGLLENTLQFFCSDNGPEGKTPKPGERTAGVTGGLRGRKRDLYDGGVRVPSLAVWPGKLKAGEVNNIPMSTLDYLPTLVSLVGYSMPDNRPIDGQDMMPLLTGKAAERTKSIPFCYDNMATLVKGRYKLVTQNLSKNDRDVLYDLSKDWNEKKNIVSDHASLASEMKEEISAFLKSAKSSHSGSDYGTTDSYKPVDPWRTLGPKSNTPSKKKKKKNN